MPGHVAHAFCAGTLPRPASPLTFASVCALLEVGTPRETPKQPPAAGDDRQGTSETDKKRGNGMALYEGIAIVTDIRGSATAGCVGLVTDRLMEKSMMAQNEFTHQLATRPDSAADCDEILATMAKSRERRRSEGRFEAPSRIPQETPQVTPQVDATPRTIAEIMGWGDDHVPAEQAASPIVPAQKKPEPEAGETGKAPLPDDGHAAPTPNEDVVVEFGDGCVGGYAGGAWSLGTAPADSPYMSERLRAEHELEEFVRDAISRLDVCRPRAMSLRMLVQMAHEEWLARRIEKEPGVDRATLRLPQDDFARKNIVTNFVKHELVFPRYDDVVGRINAFGKRGVESVHVERCYAKWRLAVIDRISEAIPELANAANAQRLRRYDQQSGRLVALGE